MRMQGQVAIVTGGGTGIGRGIVLAYAREGASLVVNYSKSREASEKTAAEARAAGGKSIAVDTAFLPRTEEERAKGRRGVHTIRATEPEDIGKMAVFLAADAPVTTAHVLFADGATTTLGRKA